MDDEKLLTAIFITLPAVIAKKNVKVRKQTSPITFTRNYNDSNFATLHVPVEREQLPSIDAWIMFPKSTFRLSIAQY